MTRLERRERDQAIVDEAKQLSVKPLGPHFPTEYRKYRSRAHKWSCAGCDYWTEVRTSRTMASRQIIDHCAAANAAARADAIAVANARQSEFYETHDRTVDAEPDEDEYSPFTDPDMAHKDDEFDISEPCS